MVFLIIANFVVTAVLADQIYGCLRFCAVLPIESLRFTRFHVKSIYPGNKIAT